MSRNFDPDFIPKKNYFLVGVKTLVFNKDGKFLLLLRSEKVSGGGRWSLPGGALEHGENTYDAATRELDEETLIKVKNLECMGIKTYINDDNDSIVIIGFRCVHESGAVDLNWEHDDFKWVSKKEALGHKLTPDAKYFIDLIE